MPTPVRTVASAPGGKAAQANPGHAASTWLVTASPDGLRLLQSATAPPPRLTEAALIAAMEAHGIGTDATVAEHIQKQLERGCGPVRAVDLYCLTFCVLH